MLILKGPDDDMEDETEQGVTELVIRYGLPLIFSVGTVFKTLMFQFILSIAFVSSQFPLYEFNQ